MVTSSGSEKGKKGGGGEEREGGEVRARGEGGWFVLKPTVTPGGWRMMVQLALPMLLRLACSWVPLMLASTLLLLDLAMLTELLLFPGLLGLLGLLGEPAMLAPLRLLVLILAGSAAALRLWAGPESGLVIGEGLCAMARTSRLNGAGPGSLSPGEEAWLVEGV